MRRFPSFSRVRAGPVGPAVLVAALLALPSSALAVASATPASPHGGAGLSPIAARALAPVVIGPRHGHSMPVPSGGSRLQGVDPFAYYSGQPAPMGIADFGVTPSGTPYDYQTNEFDGITAIKSLRVYNASAFDVNALTIQENIVLQFVQGGTQYYYWIQNVAYLNTSTDVVSYENNIWNFSGGAGTMDSDSVSGNGSVEFDEVYITGASPSLPGNDVTLSYPSTIQLISIATTASGKPMVDFDYRDGHGLVCYDNAVFPFAKGATDINFTVNGTYYNPIGLYNDAELDLGGPGGGEATTVTSGNVSMSLEYSNGVNLQPVENAYNFGSDTAEAIGPLTSRLAINPVNGTLADQLTYGAAAPIANLYNNSSDGLVAVQSLAGAGTLSINGTTGIPFAGNPANLTLAAGSYLIGLYVNGTRLGETNVTVGGGTFQTIYLDAGTLSTLSFQETGLTTGHPWAVDLNGAQRTSTTSTIDFTVLNLTYSWRIPEIPGWIPNATHGALTIQGANVVIAINFSRVLYEVTLFESGLPSGTTWSLNVTNETFLSSSASVRFGLPNGTWHFRINEIPGYIGTHGDGGTFHMSAAEITQTFDFVPFTYDVNAYSSGLPGGVAWTLKVGNLTTNGSIPRLSIAEPNGSYAFHVLPPAGWNASVTSGTAIVAAANYSVNVSFAPYLFAVSFSESGLPLGTLWGVNLSGTLANATTPTFTLELANGSYLYTPLAVPGYVLTGTPNGTFEVSGAPTSVHVVYGPEPALYGTLVLTFSPDTATILIDGTVVAASGGSLTDPLVVGPHAIEVSAPGYQPFFDNFTILHGGTTALSALLVALPSTPSGPGTPGNGGHLTVHPSSGPAPLSPIEIAGIALAILAIVGVAAAVALRRRQRRA